MLGRAAAVELVFDPQVFVAAPRGRCLLGPNLLAWFCADDFSVLRLWGQPTEHDLVCMMAFKQARCQPSLSPHRTLLDLQRLQHVERSHFERLLAHNQALRQGQPPQPGVRVAVVRPAGFVGAAIEGFLALEQAPVQSACFTAMGAALAWLPVSEPAALLAELAALEQRMQLTPRTLEELRRRTLAGEELGSLAQAAQRLGVSVRTLQRQLQTAQTTYREERNRLRVERAQELLRTSELKLFAIAQAVGLQKPQHLSALFRRLTGEAPAAFRKRIRPAETGLAAPSPPPASGELSSTQREPL